MLQIQGLALKDGMRNGPKSNHLWGKTINVSVLRMRERSKFLFQRFMVNHDLKNIGALLADNLVVLCLHIFYSTQGLQIIQTMCCLKKIYTTQEIFLVVSYVTRIHVFHDSIGYQNPWMSSCELLLNLTAARILHGYLQELVAISFNVSLYFE